MDRKHYAVAFLAVLLGALLVLCYRIAEPFVAPAIIAALFALGLKPVHDRIRKAIPSPAVAALVTIVLAVVILLVPLIFVATTLVAEIRDLYQLLNSQSMAEGGWSAYIFHQMERLQALLTNRLGLPVPDLASELRQSLGEVAGWTAKGIGQAAQLVGSSVLGGVISLIVLFFLLRDGPELWRQAIGLLPIREENAARLTAVAGEAITANLYGVVAVAFVQGGLLCLAFWFLSLPSPVLWGTIGGLLSMIPFLGTALVWVPMAIWLVVAGSYGKAAILAVWGAVVIGLSDNIIRPLLVSGRTKQHPLLMFFAMLGGTQAFGLMGILLGPVVVAVTIAIAATLRAELPIREAAIPVEGYEQSGVD